MPLFRPRTPLSSSSPHQPCSPMSSPWPSPLLWSKLWHLLLRLLSYKSIVAPDHVLAYHALMTPSILRMKCDTLCPPGLCHCLPTTVSSHQSLGHTGLNHTGIPWLSCTLSRPHAFVPRASWPGMPFSPTYPNGHSPEPAQMPLLWEGGSPGSVIRTQDDTLSMPTAPCLCCSWTET